MEKKIKILFAIPRFSVGGAEKFLIHHLANIDRDVYDVRLIIIFAEQQGSSCAGEVHIDRCFRARSTWDIVAFFKMLAYVRTERFDVVVTHLFTANLLIRFAAIVSRVPVVISYEHNIYPNKRHWQIVADQVLARWTDRIVVDSPAAKTFTAEQEKISLEKFETIIIPPLLDTKGRRNREEVLRALAIPPDSIIIVTVSRLVIDKGHTYLIDAAGEILKKHGDVYFLIGGWGPLRADLEAQVRRLSLDEHVRILGRVDGQEYTSLADIYVDPAISTDLPLGIMEAMLLGKATVATSVGEIPQFVQDGKTGLVVPPADSMALAMAVETMLSDEALRKRFGLAAKQKVSGYSMEEYMRTFDALIAKCLST